MTRPDDDAALGVRLLHLVPDLHLLGLLAREHDMAVAVLGTLQQHVDRVARLHRDLPILVEEFRDGDDPFRLVSDIDDHLGGRDLQHRPLDDVSFAYVAEAAVVHGQEPGVLFLVHRLVVAAEAGVTTSSGFVMLSVFSSFFTWGCAPNPRQALAGTLCPVPRLPGRAVRGLGTTASMHAVPSVRNRSIELHHISYSATRPKPPASASGDPFAPCRDCRAAPCAAWARLLRCTPSPPYATVRSNCTTLVTRQPAPNPRQALAGTPLPRAALAGPRRARPSAGISSNMLARHALPAGHLTGPGATRGSTTDC